MNVELNEDKIKASKNTNVTSGLVLITDCWRAAILDTRNYISTKESSNYHPTAKGLESEREKLEKD